MDTTEVKLYQSIYNLVVSILKLVLQTSTETPNRNNYKINTHTQKNSSSEVVKSVGFPWWSSG